MTIVQYLVHQLATHLVIEARERCRELDKTEGRNTADDLEYVGTDATIHVENCTVHQITDAIATLTRCTRPKDRTPVKGRKMRRK